MNHFRCVCAAIITTFLFVSCGGKSVAPGKTADLTLPNDLAKAFEVKDFGSNGQAVAVAVPDEKAAAAPKLSAKEAAKEARKKAREKKAAARMKLGKGEEVAEMPGIDGPGSRMTIVIPNRRPKADPIWVGEKIWMDVTWLATKAGEFEMEVLPFKQINGRKVYDIKGIARTSDLFSMIYKAEDWVESYIDFVGWFPYKFVLHGDETKHIRNNLELFDHGAKKQYVHIVDYRVKTNELHENKEFKELERFSQDSLSSLYYARTLDLPDGAVRRFPMTTSGSQVEAQLTVVGREEIGTRMGSQKAIKTKVETRFNGVLQQQGDAFIWFSDDDRKFVLRFEAKVKIGWISGIVKKIEPGQRPVENESAGRLQKIGLGAGLPRIPNHGIVLSAVEKKAARVKGSTEAAKPRLWFQGMMDSFQDSSDKK